MRYDFVRARHDEDRCVKSNCPFEKVEGADFCPRHGANKQLEKKANKLMYDLKMERMRKRLDLLKIDSSRYRLDEELGLLRLTLEDTLNAVASRSQDPEYALFQASDTIRSLIATIKDLTVSCVAQSRELGLLMTADQYLEEVSKIIQIIGEEIHDEETVIRIANRISRPTNLEGAPLEGNQPVLELGPATQIHRESEEQVRDHSMVIQILPLDEGDAGL